MAYTPKATPEIRSIRRDNLRHILDYFGTSARLSEAFPSINKSSIANIIEGRNGMGEGNARRWEEVLNLPDRWFDQARSVVPDHLVKSANNPPESFMPKEADIKHEDEPTARRISIEKKEMVEELTEELTKKIIPAYEVLEKTEKTDSCWFIEIPVDISDSGRVLKSLADAGYQRITVYKR